MEGRDDLYRWVQMKISKFIELQEVYYPLQLVTGDNSLESHSLEQVSSDLQFSYISVTDLAAKSTPAAPGGRGVAVVAGNSLATSAKNHGRTSTMGTAWILFVESKISFDGGAIVSFFFGLFFGHRERPISRPQTRHLFFKADAKAFAVLATVAHDDDHIWQLFHMFPSLFCLRHLAAHLCGRVDVKASTLIAYFAFKTAKVNLHAFRYGCVLSMFHILSDPIGPGKHPTSLGEIS